MVGRGEMAKFGVEPERQFEGSGHMLGVLKRLLYRGEFLSGPQLDLNKIVANHTKDGEVKFESKPRNSGNGSS